MPGQKPRLIILVGPTAVGKTGTAIELAEPMGGQIISADAMQVYRYMDIGTAKPTDKERARVRHYLIDVVTPDAPFSAARFRMLADTVAQDLYQKGIPTFVVGGTGLYIKALTKGLFDAKAQDGSVRKRLISEAKTLGLAAVYERLCKVDPRAATRIHANDTYRIIRALEVFEVTGKPISYHHQAHGFSGSRYATCKIGLCMDRDILYDRIDRRVEQMIARGFVEEVQGLLDQGFGADLKPMQSIGYRHVTRFLLGQAPWDETIEHFKRDTRRYAKRQLTWFRADPDIVWFEPSDIDAMRKKVGIFLGKQSGGR